MSHYRYMFFPPSSTTASIVYGTGGSFTTYGSLQSNGMALDAVGGLYVSESWYNRVLYYPPGSLTPSRVYGQAGNFSGSTANLGGISADSLNRPTGVAVDSSGGLYIGDSQNYRVLYYPPGSTTATRVYGEG
jgi:sugar lactone lactonase YvrE